MVTRSHRLICGLVLGSSGMLCSAFVAMPFHHRRSRRSSTSEEWPVLLSESSAHLSDTVGPSEPDKDIDNIFLQNQQWKAKKLHDDADFFADLGAGHNPQYMWIGCADARVPANVIMGEDAGSVFVVRNVANMVVNTDFNLMSALQFAVDVKQIPHIVVCGHYDCGGVRASMEKRDHVPPLENWLRNIRDVYRLHKEELDGIADPEARNRRLVELNVIEQCINLFKTGVVQRRRVQTFKEHLSNRSSSEPKGEYYTTPRIHACVFDPTVGDLKRLEVNFQAYIEDLHDIYDLYSVEEDNTAREEPEH